MDPLIADKLTRPLQALADASAADPFDVVVVGGGSAGITTARTLAEAHKRVALLEAGPLALLTHVQSTDLRFDPDLVRAVQGGLQYSPPAADGTPFGALIGCVGGRGLFWNGAAPRFSAADMAGWPFDPAALASCYDWAEAQFHVTRAYGGGRLGQEVCRRLQAGNFAAEPGPYAVDDHPTRDGWLAGTVGNSLSPLLRSTLLTAPSTPLSLATRSFVSKVIVEQGRARGVEAMDRDQQTPCRVLARSVVLAAGAFESVRLALASGVPDPNGLVGRYISDHLFVRAYYPVAENLYDPATPEAAIVWIPAENLGRQFEVHLPADNLFVAQGPAPWKPDGSAYYAAMVRSFAPVQPRADNFIEALAGSGPGSFRVHLSLGADDQALRQQQIDSLEKIRLALGAGEAPLQTMPLGASHHESGGLCLGASAEASVVDPFGRWWGMDNVRVFDSAAWPSPSPTNPHLTIVAVARRQALQMAAEL